MLWYSQQRAAYAQRHHRNHKNVASNGMSMRALAEANGNSTRQQANDPGTDMKE
jgi:hypothetical protein